MTARPVPSLILQTPITSIFSRRPLQLLLVAIAIGACVFAIRSAATFGLSRLLATYAVTAPNLPLANEAIALAPKDAEAHFAKAYASSWSNPPRPATAELEQAVALRPADYTLWEQLGLARDQNGDSDGALKAFAESVTRAPYYSQPRWDRGNVLLRNRQYEPAFNDLSQAAQSNPELIPSLIDLAWGLSRGDVNLAEQLIQIKTDKMRIAFAKLLARKGRGPEAVAQLASASAVPESVRSEVIDELSARGAHKAAFDLWTSTHGIKRPSGPSIYDGGFEGTLAFGAGGFSWRVPRNLQAASLSLDPSQPHSGSQDLKIEFDGDSNPGQILISQLILVEPSKRYKINFACRSQELVTGGLPLLVVSDASRDPKRLGQSPPLGKGSSDWQVFSFEFTTTPATTAVVLSLQRENCSTSPCPIFGAVSLDSFSLEQVK